MTVAPLPPHPRSVREMNGGPSVLPTPHQPEGDDFAETLRAMAGDAGPRGGSLAPIDDSAERFNENGFFADADAVAVPGQAIIAPTGTPVSTKLPPDIAALSALDLIAQSGPSTASARADIIGGANATPTDNAVPWAASIRASMATTVASRPLAESLPRTSPRVSITEAAVSSSVGKTRAVQREADRSPINVSINTGEGAAAITVTAPGLGDREAEALRNDIRELLRRHGLVLDDLRLNGRAMGQAKDQSEG